MKERCYVHVNGLDVEIIKRANGCYYAKYYPRPGKRKRIALNTRNILTARAAAQKAVEQDMQGGRLAIKNTKLTFEEFVELYFNENPGRYRSEVKIRSVLKVICERGLGKIPIGDIMKKDILSYVSVMSAAKKSPHTINKTIGTLKAVLEYARIERYIPLNPAENVKKFQVFSRERYLKIDEFIALLMSSPAYIREMIIISVHLGIRKGELLNLKWGNVDLDNRVAVIEKTKSGLPRYIQLTDKVYELLRNKYMEKKRAYEDYVFANPEGKPFADVNKAFKKSLKRANIQNLRWHDLRRTYAVYYAQATGDLNSLKANLGHSRLEVTQHYLPMSLEQQRAGALKFESYLLLKAGEEKDWHKFGTLDEIKEVI